MPNTDLNTLFQQAVNGYDKAFLDAESAITAEGETATQFLSTKQADASLSDFEHFIAATLADSIAGAGTKYAAAVTAIQAKQKRARQTPVGTPVPDTIAGLYSIQGADITDLVALHLVKERQWPHWMSMAAIIYLGYYAGPSVLPAFDQFMADLNANKRVLDNTLLQTQTNPVFNTLVESMELVRIVIKDDTYKSNIARAQTLSGTEQEAAKADAVASAVSVLTSNPEDAQKLRGAQASLSELLIQPLFKSTDGIVDTATVRKVLANYLLGYENDD